MKRIIINNQVTPYYITKDGKCLNGDSKKFLKGQLSNSGYLNYNLTLSDGKKKRFYAHRLVARFYINNGAEIPKGYEVNHKNCNKKDNRLDNLEIITCKENSQHAWDNHCNKSMRTVYQFDKNFNLIGKYYNAKEASLITGVSNGKIISQLLSDKPSLTKEGHYWSYLPKISSKTVLHPKKDGRPKTVLQYDLEGNFVAKYSSCGEAKRKNFPEMKRGTGHISECCRGKIKKYKGYIWKYEDDIV